MTAVYKIVLIRHGESQWNLENRFCGWHDADLSAKGHEEAKQAGKVSPFISYTFGFFTKINNYLLVCFVFFFGFDDNRRLSKSRV